MKLTQYVLPNGKKKEIRTKRPANIEAMAARFVEAGGRYEMEKLRTGQISFTACAEVDGEMQDIAIALSPNGPEAPAALDDVIRKSITWLDAQ